MTGTDPGVPPAGGIAGYVPWVIYPDQLMARVFKPGSGFRCASFNPTIPDPPQYGGRFDRTRLADSAYMYASVLNPDALPMRPDVNTLDAAQGDVTYTALIETLRPLFAPTTVGFASHAIQQKELAERAIQFFTVRREIKLASLTSPDALSRLNGNEDICISGDRSATQAWSTYWQEHLPDDVAGLAYNSTPSTVGKGVSVVLWESRVGSDSVFVPAGPEYGLSSFPFARSVAAILQNYGVDIV